MLSRGLAAMKRYLTPARALPLALCATAVLMVGLMLLPARVWNVPEIDATYSGFDKTLIYVDERGYGKTDGDIEVSQDNLQISSFPGSKPVAYIVSADRDFTASMDVVVVSAPSKGTPLSIGVWRPGPWRPTVDAGQYLTFGGSPDNTITATTIRDGKLASPVDTGEVLTEQTLGGYNPGMLYNVKLDMKSREGTLRTVITGNGGPPSGSRFLKVDGQDDISTVALIPVKAEQSYVARATVRLLSGSGAFAVGLYWYDSEGRRLPSANYWVPTSKLSGWTDQQIGAQAPDNAAFAKMYVAVALGTTILFSDMSFHQVDAPSSELLPDATLVNSAAGWRSSAHPSSGPVVVVPSVDHWTTVVTAQDAPELFKTVYIANPVNLSVTSEGENGTASAILSDFVLSLPHWNGYGVKIQDRRADWMVIGLSVVGSILLGLMAVPPARRAWRELKGWAKGRAVSVRVTPATVVIGSAVGAYLVANAAIANLSGATNNLTNDAINARIAFKYGVGDVYFLPFTEAYRAVVWGGVPYVSGSFVVGPLMAYLGLATSWLYHVFLIGPTDQFDATRLGLVMKWFNMAFAVANAWLIFQILRNFQVSRRVAAMGAAFYLFNPAVWLLTSLWGTTHSQSVFFLLGAIWSAQRRNPLGAWLFLACAALSRAQLYVPVAIMALVLVKVFPIGANIRGLACTIVAAFIVLTPLSLSVSPSLALDNVRYLSRVQNQSDPDVESNENVSGFAYSLWPLVTRQAQGALGRARFAVTQNTRVFGGVTYRELSNLLSLGAVVVIVLLVAARRNARLFDSAYLCLVSASLFLALYLKTGSESAHFSLLLPLVVTLWKPLPRWQYFGIVGSLTLVVLVTSFAHYSSAIAGVPKLEPIMHWSTNSVTRFFANLYGKDWFITLGVLLNGYAIAFITAAGAGGTLRGLAAFLPAGLRARRGSPSKAEHQ